MPDAGAADRAWSAFLEGVCGYTDSIGFRNDVDSQARPADVRGVEELELPGLFQGLPLLIVQNRPPATGADLYLQFVTAQESHAEPGTRAGLCGARASLSDRFTLRAGLFLSEVVARRDNTPRRRP